MSDLNTRVTVIPADSLVIVGTEYLKFSFQIVNGYTNLQSIQWKDGKGDMSFTDGNYRFIFGEELYNQEVKPYVDLWQIEKDRIAAEKAAAEAIYNSLENTQARALSKLNSDLDYAKKSPAAYVTSTVGFDINANKDAADNIDGLIKLVTASPESTTFFMDYHNVQHSVTLDQLKTMQLEVLSRGPALYARKWQIRAAITACTSSEAVNTLVWDSELNLTNN